MSIIFLNSATCLLYFFFFFFNDTATTEIYTLSLHDALPISFTPDVAIPSMNRFCARKNSTTIGIIITVRSEEHTSELQSRPHLVCRLLLEKKKKKKIDRPQTKRQQPHHKAL